MKNFPIFYLNIYSLFLFSIIFLSVDHVQAIDCHNCISHEDDPDSCEPLTLGQLRKQMRDIEGPDFQVSEDPDACVRMRLQTVLGSSEDVIIRSQIKLNDESRRALFQLNRGTVFPSCEERFVNSFINRGGAEVNVLTCACIIDNCNGSGRRMSHYGIISSFLLFLALFL